MKKKNKKLFFFFIDKTMSFVSSNNLNQTNFSVMGSTSSVGPNRMRSDVIPVSHRQDLGATGITIPPIYLCGPCISMVPQLASQSFAFPSAAQMLQLFGRNLETGLSRIAPGTVMEFQFINRGAVPCEVVASGTGGDSSLVACATGAGNLGKGTKVFLEWIAVNSGLNGCTGEYTIYA